MESHRDDHARMILRGQAAGGITRADIERRAREIAMIRDGTSEYSEEDLAAAERELLQGGEPPTTTEDLESNIAISRDPSEPPSNSGTRQPIGEAGDENAAAEHLALQGVDEAQHDQMIEARRRRREGR